MVKYYNDGTGQMKWFLLKYQIHGDPTYYTEWIPAREILEAKRKIRKVYKEAQNFKWLNKYKNRGGL